jgi:hypothetical protein
VVERLGEVDDPFARQRVVARLEADNPAAGGRNADRARGIGADGEANDARRDGRGRSAARAAGSARWRGGIQHVAKVRVGAGDAVGELVKVGEPDEDRARTPQPRDHLGITVRGRAIEGLAAGAERRASHEHQVFHRDGHATEQPVGCRLHTGRKPRERVQLAVAMRPPQRVGGIGPKRDIAGAHSSCRSKRRGAREIRRRRRRFSSAKQFQLGPVHLEAGEPCVGSLAVTVSEPIGIPDQRFAQQTTSSLWNRVQMRNIRHQVAS